MEDYRISKWFSQKRIDSIIEDIYSDSTYSEFYDFIGRSDIYNDIHRFTTEIKKEPVLEVGTGNGRVLTELLKKNIDIYGIEPSEQMLDLIEPASKGKVYKETFESFIENLITKDNYIAPRTIIIPATTISLFKPITIINILKKFQNKFHFLPDFIFDYNKISLFSNDLKYQYTDKGKFYYSNHIFKDKIFFNLYKDGKLGISKKYIYNFEIISEVALKLKYNNRIVFENENYCMVKLYEQ